MTETLPGNKTPTGVAVNQTTHHFYVVGLGVTAGELSVVYNFDPSGRIDSVDPELTGAPSLKPFRIAVDNSATASGGYVYVTDVTHKLVQQFDQEGHATGLQISESSLPLNGTPQTGGLPPVANHGSWDPGYVAVDTSGTIFVYDSYYNFDSQESEPSVDEFLPNGEFVKQLPMNGTRTFAVTGIALDSSDHIYLTATGFQPGLFELDGATGECVQAGCAPIDPEPAYSVSFDISGGVLYAGSLVSEDRGFEGRFSEYDAATGELLGVNRPQTLHSPQAISVDETSGNVIIGSSPPSGNGTVQIYGPLEIVPDVVTLTPEDVDDRSVIMRGEIGAADVDGATCTFQYVDEAGFKTHGFEGASEAPCEAEGQPAGPYSGSEMHEVEAKVEGLRGGTIYHERILGTNSNGSIGGEDITFTTNGPTVSSTEAADVDVDAATLEALVNPNGDETTYRFQYLTEAQFEASGWAGANEAPVGGQGLGSGTEPVAISERIEGLQAHTAYRFRVLATSSGDESAGETRGEEVPFSTFAPPTTGLPDTRRYEQASPTDKNGTNAQGAVNSVQASLDGSRITFFANAGIPGGEGAQQFPTFLASRAADSSGWSTRGLLPPATFGPRAAVVGWTEDLEGTYDFASRPFEPGKLLLRNSATGSLSEVGTIQAQNNPFAYAGSSRGGVVVLLETAAGSLLPGDREGKQNLYAYGPETNTLAIAGVMNDGSVPAGGAMAGPYDWFRNRTTFGGGALAAYFTQAQHAIAADGSRVFFTAGGTGQLYVRLNPLAAQSAMNGEKCTEPARACTVHISAPEEGVADPGTPAAFLGASSDGDLVYFLDRGRLTSDATAGVGSDLYRYDLESGDLVDLTPDTGDKDGARVEGMLGIGGPRGEDAYFVAAGGLAEGTAQASIGETNLYALHGTTINYVTRLGTKTVSGNDNQIEPLNWTPSSQTSNQSEVRAHASRVSADGQTLLFNSARQLTSYRNNGVRELYLYRTGQGISCISCNPTGEAPAGPSGVQEIPNVGYALSRSSSFMTRNLSADGRRVIFDSADRLLAADRNDVNDVYEWEARGKGSCSEEAVAGGCLYLISGGAEGAGPSWFGDADEEGDNVFFFTAQSLVAQDRDELVDVYDARVGGGIADQEVTPPSPCEGEAGCRGSVPTPPSPPSPGSSAFTGPGNPKAARRCPRGKVRKKRHCVGKHNKHHKRHTKHHKRHKNASRHGRERGGQR
ncbi:MAG TPA: hypothetical protein VFK14_11780 [Solirubrobacterales bacterium]|nr:hypothetical protein [Solirubrobacterales bacterium]